MRSVAVQAGNQRYEICIAPGLLEDAGLVKQALLPWRGRRAVIVADAHTAPLFGARVAELLRQADIESALVTVPAGEASKCHEQLLRLYDAFLDLPLTRSDLVVALGGGVVGDLAGYAAASYQRGAPLLQIPTTLLAQVDSSVGGKVAVNLPRGKNLVGAFHQPALVLIDPRTLRTLDARQLGAGLGEIVKYGCIADAALFEQLEASEGRPDIAGEMEALIARCCEIKADYVRRDPFDYGARMELNFGHTLGHALENTLGYGVLLHGEAVCIGMVAAARWGERLGVSPAGTAERIRALLMRCALPVDLSSVPAKPPIQEVPIEALFRAMALDKKAEGDAVRVVLLEEIGRATVRAVPRGELAELLAEEVRA